MGYRKTGRVAAVNWHIVLAVVLTIAVMGGAAFVLSLLMMLGRTRTALDAADATNLELSSRVARLEEVAAAQIHTIQVLNALANNIRVRPWVVNLTDDQVFGFAYQIAEEVNKHIDKKPN
jgi:magnesium-transporting ATPase (P-type)